MHTRACAQSPMFDESENSMKCFSFLMPHTLLPESSFRKIHVFSIFLAFSLKWSKS